VTSRDPSLPLQAGLYALLTADAELMDLDGFDGVFDEAPEGAAGDYVVLGPRTSSTPDNVHGSHGRQSVITLETWTRARSTRPGSVIAARLVELLDHQQEALDPLVDGHTVWALRWEQHQSVIDPERGLRRRTDLFRISTAQEE
jgi:hypothetical protein